MRSVGAGHARDGKMGEVAGGSHQRWSVRECVPTLERGNDQKSAGEIARAVGCAVRTMFFRWHRLRNSETDDHPWRVPAGNIEEKCSIGGCY